MCGVHNMKGCLGGGCGYLSSEVLVDVGQQGRGSSDLAPTSHARLPGVQPELLVESMRPLQALETYGVLVRHNNEAYREDP